MPRRRGGGAGGGTPGKDLPLSVVDQGLEMALVPQVHSLREAQANVLGPTNPWCRLQHSCDEHQGTLRIPEALTNAAEFGHQDGEEPPPHFAGRSLVSCGGQLRHPAPPSLPESVGGDAAIEVDPGIVMHVIPDGGIQKAIRRGYKVARQIGSRVRSYFRTGSRLWIFPGRVIGPIGR